jgi:hypothetical protein
MINNFKKTLFFKINIFKKDRKMQKLADSTGNISILLLTLTLFFLILFIPVFDIFQLYIAREHTKNASDAIALAAAQNLLYFDKDKIVEIAYKISIENNCDIDSIEFNYDEVIVTTVKKVEFIFIGKIIRNSSLIYSTSKVKVTYPWDEKFKNCKSFKFEF